MIMYGVGHPFPYTRKCFRYSQGWTADAGERNSSEAERSQLPTQRRCLSLMLSRARVVCTLRSCLWFSPSQASGPVKVHLSLHTTGSRVRLQAAALGLSAPCEEPRGLQDPRPQGMPHARVRSPLGRSCLKGATIPVLMF